jgi:DNA topoisomerase-3
MEAKKRGIPPFRIFSDETLAAIASARPEAIDELLLLHGVGPSIAKKYGDAILQVIRREGRRKRQPDNQRRDTKG